MLCVALYEEICFSLFLLNVPMTIQISIIPVVWTHLASVSVWNRIVQVPSPPPRRNGARNVRFQFVHLPLGTSYATRSEWPNIVIAMMIIIHPQAIMINETHVNLTDQIAIQSTKSLPSTLFSRKLFLILTEKLQPFQDIFDNHKKIELHILKPRWTICNLRHTYVKKVFQLSHYNPLLGPSPLIYMSDIWVTD